MKIKITLGLLSFLSIILFFSGFSGKNYLSTSDKISQVKIYTTSGKDIAVLFNNGIDADEYFGNIKDGIILNLKDFEISKLNSLGFRYDILIDNLDDYYKQLPIPNESVIMQNREVMHKDGINGYTLGSWTGFHYYTEIIHVLDTLRLLYPNLISVKQNIGTSIENRTLYSVKISDNPDVDESATEPGVYFDGIHHAREPMSMEVQLYYMWWLLENYSSNSEAQHLVNNREIFFVPIVNPDGYVYNETYAGRDWRKNRRNSGACFGVDLNRNYSYGWGIGSGSSSDPCSDTYRGTSANSEPETQAVKNFVLAKHPKIGMSLHSAAGYNLNPLSYTDTVVAFSIYSDFSSEFGETNQFLYGNVMEMLQYYSAGTTRDYLHMIGCYSWTSEMEGSNFWPASANIIPMCSRFMPTLKLVTWNAGAYAKMQNFSVTGKGWASKNDTLQLKITVRNKGLTMASKNVTVELTSTYAGITPLVSSVNYDSISARQIKVNTSNPFKFKIPASAVIADNMMFVATVKQENIVASRDTFYVTVGKTDSLFSDNAENGLGKWTTTSNKLLWDTTYVSSWSGSKSFADSRYGNSKDATQSYFNLTPAINLTGRFNPRLEFAVKFATEVGYDYTRIQVSTDAGSTWTNLTGRYTKTLGGQPSYVGVKYWVYEQINLTSYIGKTIKLRFYYYTDAGTPGDGVYIDDFRIIDYKDVSNGITNNGNEIPSNYALLQNYPNPFNPVTQIKFDLPKQGFVKLTVFDMLGREITKLVNEVKPAGSYIVNFDANELSSGIYYYKLESGNFSDIKKMTLVK